MNFLHKSILGLSFAVLFCTQGCFESKTTKPISGPSSDDELDFDSLTEEERELAYTGSLLSIFYVNADKELREFEYYNHQGEKNGFDKRYEYPDVFYMFSTLSDNYTNYFSPSDADYIMSLLLYSSANVGIGVDMEEVEVPQCEEGEEGECDKTQKVLVFKHVYPKAPADKAGILKGDTLVSIDEVKVNNNSAFIKLATGQIDDSTSIVVKRGEDVITYTVKFQEFLSPTVFVDEVDSIPVITITEYSDTTYMATGTYGEFVEALKETKNAKSTIIDLRGNPGGSVEQCMNMTAEFLSKNDTIAFMVSHELDTIIDDRVIDTLTWITEENGYAKDRYLVFLADSGSASCAELMLVGTVSNKKSPVVGLTTYGKGIGQTYIGTYAGGIAGITSMRMFDKNKKIYHRFGIEPDYIEGDPDKAMEIAVQLAKERTAVRTKEYGSVDTGHFTLAKTHANAKKLERGGAYKVIRDKIQKPIPFK